MPLSDDQRAMLRLLAQREQGYEDIAALMGVSVEEVRAKVNEALAQLEHEGIAPPPLPAEPPPATSEEPEPPAAPVEPAAPAPGPPEPKPAAAAEPVAEKPLAAPRKPPRRPAPALPKISLPSGRGPRAAIAAGAAVVVLVIVVLIVSGGGGDGGEGSTATSASTSPTSAGSGAAQGNSSAEAKEVTKAVLNPVGGGSATGVAIFGRVKNSLALQVEVEGLEPTAKGQSYTVWMAQSPQRMLPLASTPVGKSGRIGAQFEVPTEVLAYLANGTFDQLVITRTSVAVLKTALAKATKEERAPAYTGSAVLRGTITGPIVGAASR